VWEDEFADLCGSHGGCRRREVDCALYLDEGEARGRVEELRKGVLGAWGGCGGAWEMNWYRRHRGELIGFRWELK